MLSWGYELLSSAVITLSQIFLSVKQSTFSEAPI